MNQASTTEPIEVSLLDVEQDQIPESSHWKLGPHFALYPGCIYQYSQSKHDHSEPDRFTKIDYCYYPVFSQDHPYIQKLVEVFGRYEDDEDIPEEAFPLPENCRVLIKTKVFKTIGDIPDELDLVDSRQGLVINLVSNLKDDEIKLLKTNFRGLDENNLYILEEGRKPKSAFVVLAMILGGIALM